MKSDRLDAIKRLVATRPVQSQEELQTLLKTEGYEVTQATLSRDLRALHVVKIHDGERGYRYELPAEKHAANTPATASLTPDSIRSIEFSDGRAVIKTYPGFADPVATIIDDNIRSGIMGTIAGDDTVLVIMRESARWEDFLATISYYIPGIENKVIS